MLVAIQTTKIMHFFTKLTNLFCRVSSSENMPVDENSVDLITVGQALHWFVFAKFYNEVIIDITDRTDAGGWQIYLISAAPERQER